MSLKCQVFLIVILSIFPWSYCREFLSGLPEYHLNRNALKKRKQEQTIKEWFLFTRFKKEIPKSLLKFYYFITIIHPLFTLAWLLTLAIDLPLKIGEVIIKIILIFDFVWIEVIRIIFKTFHRNGYAYERVFKKHGQQKKPKK